MPLYINLFIVLSETWTNKTLKKQQLQTCTSYILVIVWYSIVFDIYYSNILILFMYVWFKIYNQA